MAYHIYHTQGIILGSVPVGESNRFYKIFTAELGLVHASAQAVREGKSKLRYALQDFSLVTLDLVRGKEVWRITSAGEILGAPRDLLSARAFARTCRLISRLVHGEGREELLYQDFVAARKFLANEPLTPSLAPSFETLSALRTLVLLGYAPASGYEEFLVYGIWSTELLERFGPVQAGAIVIVNTALASSHL